jgi:hypothetical protein
LVFGPSISNPLTVLFAAILLSRSASRHFAGQIYSSVLIQNHRATLASDSLVDTLYSVAAFNIPGIQPKRAWILSARLLGILLSRASNRFPAGKQITVDRAILFPRRNIFVRYYFKATNPQKSFQICPFFNSFSDC